MFDLMLIDLLIERENSVGYIYSDGLGFSEQYIILLSKGIAFIYLVQHSISSRICWENKIPWFSFRVSSPWIWMPI